MKRIFHVYVQVHGKGQLNPDWIRIHPDDAALTFRWMIDEMRERGEHDRELDFCGHRYWIAIREAE